MSMYILYTWKISDYGWPTVEMSMELTECSANGTLLQTKAKGVPHRQHGIKHYTTQGAPPHPQVCQYGTTSKTLLSYDSKFDTTADQTSKYKESKTFLPHKNLMTLPKWIKSDNETPHQNYHDCYRTCNTTPPSYQKNNTMMSRPVPDLMVQMISWHD